METLQTQETTIEQDVRTPQEVFQSMVDVAPDKNAVWAAVDQIRDAETASLFIEGCAEQVALHTEDESIKENPMRVTLGNILYVAGLQVVNDPYKTNEEQLADIMKPWYEGYGLITKKPQQTEQ